MQFFLNVRTVDLVEIVLLLIQTKKKQTPRTSDLNLLIG